MDTKKLSSEMIEHIPFSELSKFARNVVIKSKEQVLKGRPGDNKKPYGKWETIPSDYTGKRNDPKYPTAFICDYIPELKLHLVIIDLDVPKEGDHIPLNILKSKAAKAIENTYTVQTASGGYHIYLLSKKKPKAKQARKLNIDYQVNTGEGRGKYIITDYRWNDEGEKEYYKRLVESPTTIAIVDSSDTIFNAFLEDLENSGYIKTAQNDLKNSIIQLLKPEVRKGDRQYFSCCLSGYLRKQGFKEKTTRAIIEGVFAEDEEIQTRLENVKRTYRADIKKIKGYSYLKQLLSPIVMNELKNKTETKSTNLRDRIAQKLLKHKEPSSKEISDLINTELDLHINHKTQIYYERLEDGRFREIDYIKVVDYCNENFGSNQISDKTCKGVLSYITRPVNKDYDLLEFENGLLNTKTKEFTTDKTQLNKIPKLTLPFKWNQEANGGYIQKVFKEILDYNKNPANMELWLRIVGHMFMGYNTIAKFMIVTGPSRSGKSTLSTALERIFTISRIPTQKIVKNERFALLDLIDKDLNIDDDVSNGILKGIGFFNTVIAGHTISIEKKGLNEPLILENPQIPILIANGNSLPPVIGEGFDTRLILIKAPNVQPIQKRDETLHTRILQGQHDPELEWLVYTAITTYWDKIHEPLINQELENQQSKEYKFQSYPLLVAIESLFEDDYENGSNIPVRDVNKYLLKWSRWAYQQGKISKEHKRPSTRQIKKAMDQAGYDQKTEYYMDDDTRTSVRVYEHIKTTALVKLILGENID